MGPGDTQAAAGRSRSSATSSLINPSIGNSSYHGAFVARAEAVLERLLAARALHEVALLDDAESANEYGSTGSYMDQYHRELDWARSASDVPDHFVADGAVRSAAVRRADDAERGAAQWRSRAARDAAVRPAVHRDHHGEHDERVSRRSAPAESRRRSGAAGGSADADALVQHGGVRQSGGIHIRRLAAVGAARARARDNRRDAREARLP